MIDRNESWTWPELPASSEALDWPAMARHAWLAAMQGVPQDPEYHAEGDVWTHAGMVMEELLALPDFGRLHAHDRSVLYLATLLHDVAKPQCTVTAEDGRVRSPRHAVKGRGLARLLLYRGALGPVPFAEREHIAQLVRYHGLPLWFFDKRDTQAAVLRASQLADMRLLALLAEADVRGRVSPDRDELLERVALFREYCKEQGCWDGPFAFPSPAARFQYFRDPSSGPLYDPFDDSGCTVTLMSGLPGAGKDHWVRENGGGQPVISLDALRKELGFGHREAQGFVINTAKERAREHLRAGRDFIWNATNIVPAIRRQLVGLFREYRARVRIVYVEAPYETLLAQNRAREAAAVVPERVLEKMLRKWEVPEAWEAQEVEYAVRD